MLSLQRRCAAAAAFRHCSEGNQGCLLLILQGKQGWRHEPRHMHSAWQLGAGDSQHAATHLQR